MGAHNSADEHFGLADLRREETSLPSYSPKELVIWEEDFVDFRVDPSTSRIVAAPRDQA